MPLKPEYWYDPDLQLLSVKPFASTTKVVSQVMEVLRNKGLDQTSYAQCDQLSQELPINSKVKKRLKTWLQQHIEIQNQITSLPLLVSSDIIESLFRNLSILLNAAHRQT